MSQPAHRSPLAVPSHPLASPVHTWHLPQGFVYAVIVAAVAMWSWERWQSGYSTAIAALTASACMIVLEIALSAASPWAGRTLFGLSGSRDGRAEEGRHEGSAAGRAALKSRREIERTFSNVETHLERPSLRLESSQRRIDELEQEVTDVAHLIATLREELAGAQRTDAQPRATSTRTRNIGAADVLFGILGAATAMMLALLLLMP